MDLEDKDRLREAFLLRLYEELGSSRGPDGTLRRIAIERASSLGIDAPEEEVVRETVFYWKQRGLVGNLTSDLGGQLTADGVDRAEDLLRRRRSGAPQPPLKASTGFGDWARGEKMAEGGSAWVYLAFHKSDRERAQPHALKVLKAQKPRRLARFKAEIEAGIRLDQAGILRVVAHDLQADKPYYIAPYYSRGCLTIEHVQALSAPDRLSLFARICRAVGHAHQNGVAHRDLKPENILLDDDGSPVVADFGLCYFMGADDSEGRNTETMEQVGSRFYMAPEMADGPIDKVTTRADVYSLGKLCYWMFAGTVFDREKLHHSRFDLREREPKVVHYHVYQLLERAVLERPEDRLADANALGAIAETLCQRIAMDAPVLDLNAPQHCTFCRSAEYEIAVDPDWWAESFKPGRGIGNPFETAKQECARYGLAAMLHQPWLVLRCPRCGHVQIFQLFGGGPAGGPARDNWVSRT